MSLLVTVLIFNLLGSFLSLLGGLLLLIKRDLAYKLSHFLASFAAGTLLGTAFFDLIPEALEESGKMWGNTQIVFIYVMLGILFFFILERFLHWFHHHGFEDHQIKGKPVIPLIIIGDTIHNFIDGVAIAATFMVSIPLGILTTFAVGAHEIPQEIGDFGVMLKNKLSAKRTVAINILSALASFIGVLLAFYFAGYVEGLSIIFVSISAGFFLYIALSDLIPEIHHENKKGLAFWETGCLILGVATIYFALHIINNILNIHP